MSTVTAFRPAVHADPMQSLARIFDDVFAPIRNYKPRVRTPEEIADDARLDAENEELDYRMSHCEECHLETSAIDFAGESFQLCDRCLAKKMLALVGRDMVASVLAETR